ncbi:SH3 domain-containing protein [Desulforhopalus sp. IMCC35007]|uniref:SH3 domain-containing protein n=1 Tax=Desulforhopalus sp. IMCC35007 TaxID=2569543 RepID=UPI00145F307E|nr:SH3 domain-containing protein [Desulforhopalus sp. IMCC35007]
MNNKFKKIVVTSSLALFMASSAFAANYLSVTTDNANVRTGPGTKYPVAMELFEGYPLKVMKKEGEWYKISDYENDSGWIHESIVKDQDTVVVNAKNSLNMRSGPSQNSTIVADVERGVVLKKLSSEGQWTKVRHSSGTVGWIYSPLLWP